MDVDILNRLIKIIIIYFFIYYIFIKSINYKMMKTKGKVILGILILLLGGLYSFLSITYNSTIANVVCIAIYTVIISQITNNKFAYSAVIMMIASAIAYALFFIAIIFSFFIINLIMPNQALSEDNIVCIIIIAIFEMSFIYSIFNIKRFKNRI